MNGQEKSDPAIVAERPTNEAERSASEPAEPRAGAEGKTLRQSAFRTQGRVDASQALERIRQAATLRRQSPAVGAVCGNPARTVLCGGRSAMSVPTAIFASPDLDFPSLRLGFSFPRFVQKENSAAPRNSIRINVNATYVNAVAARPPVRPSGEPDVEGR